MKQKGSLTSKGFPCVLRAAVSGQFRKRLEARLGRVAAAAGAGGHPVLLCCAGVEPSACLAAVALECQFFLFHVCEAAVAGRTTLALPAAASALVWSVRTGAGFVGLADGSVWRCEGERLGEKVETGGGSVAAMATSSHGDLLWVACSDGTLVCFEASLRFFVARRRLGQAVIRFQSCGPKMCVGVMARGLVMLPSVDTAEEAWEMVGVEGGLAGVDPASTWDEVTFVTGHGKMVRWSRLLGDVVSEVDLKTGDLVSAHFTDQHRVVLTCSGNLLKLSAVGSSPSLPDVTKNVRAAVVIQSWWRMRQHRRLFVSKTAGRRLPLQFRAATLAATRSVIWSVCSVKAAILLVLEMPAMPPQLGAFVHQSLRHGLGAMARVNASLVVDLENRLRQVVPEVLPTLERFLVGEASSFWPVYAQVYEAMRVHALLGLPSNDGLSFAFSTILGQFEEMARALRMLPASHDSTAFIQLSARFEMCALDVQLAEPAALPMVALNSNDGVRERMQLKTTGVSWNREKGYDAMLLEHASGADSNAKRQHVGIAEFREKAREQGFDA